jgi:putative protease
MATKKKTKTKAKKKKKKISTRKVAGRKKVAAKTKAKPKARKPKAKPKTAPKAKRAAARTPAPKPKPAVPAAPPGTARIGIVTHYFSHLSVAIVQLETGNLRGGDVIHIRGHTSDFTQRVESMEVDHVHVSEARPGQSFGLRVKEHAREHDIVYKAKQ